ncbi:outer membrane protein [Xinfangfangia pollutisoli]|uniref:outer membrane protein n=1 Tax=Xinfangfangia pollutisoli TaxID=2865960 RepID=UPI001CD2657B|nr:outer membrane beta-barrel protein [Xinfangfangia pollutisoli]
MPQTRVSMSRQVAAVAALIIAAAPALAGGPVLAPEDGAPLPPPLIQDPIADWSGFYAGLGYGKIGVSLADGLDDLDLDGAAAGGFAGINAQKGHLVYGVELTYAKTMEASVEGADTSSAPLIELSGRLGYAWRDALVYARLGVASTEFDVDGASHRFNGLAYGIGLDYQISDHMALGVSYTEYDLSSGGSGAGFSARPSVIGLRISMRF